MGFIKKFSGELFRGSLILLISMNIFNFLNLNHYPVESQLMKQNSEPLKNLIINFEELFKAFKKTEYADFLT